MKNLVLIAALLLTANCFGNEYSNDFYTSHSESTAGLQSLSNSYSSYVGKLANPSLKSSESMNRKSSGKSSFTVDFGFAKINGAQTFIPYVKISF